MLFHCAETWLIVTNSTFAQQILLSLWITEKSYEKNLGTFCIPNQRGKGCRAKKVGDCLVVNHEGLGVKLTKLTP